MKGYPTRVAKCHSQGVNMQIQHRLCKPTCTYKYTHAYARTHTHTHTHTHTNTHTQHTHTHTHTGTHNIGYRHQYPALLQSPVSLQHISLASQTQEEHIGSGNQTQLKTRRKMAVQRMRPKGGCGPTRRAFSAHKWEKRG